MIIVYWDISEKYGGDLLSRGTDTLKLCILENDDLATEHFLKICRLFLSLIGMVVLLMILCDVCVPCKTSSLKWEKMQSHLSNLFDLKWPTRKMTKLEGQSYVTSYYRKQTELSLLWFASLIFLHRVFEIWTYMTDGKSKK